MSLRSAAPPSRAILARRGLFCDPGTITCSWGVAFARLQSVTTHIYGTTANEFKDMKSTHRSSSGKSLGCARDLVSRAMYSSARVIKLCGEDWSWRPRKAYE
ncbi:hypothetical protein CERSUDRAFT_115030 [Gelatoporia subvermispora B]|uniref:Uncharacterized protein n=1 Tax=Ceriporiopsis subvermispora (strain B) TaxID=914234 RepID=M2RF78_CERS8|nr:hypothetical protein CERSUDRAFT_115030 [Gelatoporia subvermispora B]